MRRYAIEDAAVVASPTDSLLGVLSAAGVRPRIYDVMFGCSGTPADNALNWLLQRFTNEQTATSLTPAPLDPGDSAADASGEGTWTTEPTYTAGEVLLNISANQRSTQRWVAAPDGELVMPATANNGAALAPVHASYAGLAEATIHFKE